MTSTRDRILETSLTLFNRYGERNITTNHIAGELGISPGNLYYYFRNKTDIVFELFERYEQVVSAFLQVPEGRPLNWQDKIAYFEAILETMWGTRFFHRDLGHLLNQDDRLRERYSGFVRQSLDSGLSVYDGLRNAGLLALTDEQMQALLVNTWVVASTWASFVHALIPPERQNESLDRVLLKQGIYQLVCLESPYLRGEALQHLDSIKARYQQSGRSTLELLFPGAEDKN